MKISNTFKITWWILLLLIISILGGYRLSDILDGKSNPFDIFILLVFTALMLAPIFVEIELFGIKLKSEIEELKKDISIKIGEIRNDIRNNQTQTLYANFHGFGPPPPNNKLPELEEEIDRLLKSKLKDFHKKTQSIKDLHIPDIPVNLFKVRYNFERELRRIWTQRFSQYEEQKSRHLPIMKIIQELKKFDIINSDLSVVLRDILSICNYSIHGEEVSLEQFDFVSKNANEVLELLKELY